MSDAQTLTAEEVVRDLHVRFVEANKTGHWPFLEENMARTVGSIGESVAAGAIFTIPAFVITKSWPSFDFEHAYWPSTVLMAVGGVLGILFVTLLRRVMVEDPELPYPESVAGCCSAAARSL